MTPSSSPFLQNQSVVRFSTGGVSSFAYSNTVNTPVLDPNLSVIKTSAGTEAVLGQPIIYSVTVVNNGNVEASVTVIDQPPDDTTFVPNSVLVAGVPLAGADPASGIPLGALQPGASLPVSFQVLLQQIPASLQVSNQATVQYSFHTYDGRTVTSSVMSNVLTLPVQQLQVLIVKQVDRAYTFIGDTVTYTVTTSNEGAQTLENVVLSDTLPPEAVFVPGSVTINQVHSPADSSESGIELGDIAPGATLFVSFQARVTAFPPAGRLVNRAEITFMAGTAAESAVSNPAETTVLDPLLQVVKTAGVTAAAADEPICYSIAVANEGNVAASVVLTDSIPEGSLYVPGSLSVNGQPRLGDRPDRGVELGTVEPGGSSVMAFCVTVPSQPGLQSPFVLSNQAKSRYIYALPDGRLVSDTGASNTVQTELRLPIVSVNTVAGPPVVDPGSIISFGITVTNSGNQSVSAILFDWLPRGTRLVPGTLRINGVLVGDVDPSAGLPIGLLAAGGGGIVITFEAEVLHHTFLTAIQGKPFVVTRFELNGLSHENTALSNTYRIILEHGDE